MKKIYAVIAAAIVVSLAPQQTKAQVNTGDSLALVAFFKSTGGKGWIHKDNWLTKKPINTWYGVYLTSNQKRVSSLILNDNNLVGKIPGKTGNMVAITYFNLMNNKISSSLPPSFSNLVNLTGLNLANNQLNGDIPDFSNVLGILNVNLIFNNMDGSIAGNNTNVSFDLDFNKFTFTTLEYIKKNYKLRALTTQDTILPIHAANNKLYVSAGGTLSANTYIWYKVENPNFKVTKIGDSTFTPTSYGTYYAIVTNSILDNMQLKSDYYKVSAPQALSISLSPNPAKDIINISFNNREIPAYTGMTATINIYDNEGRVVISQQATNDRLQINISKLHAGNYRLVVNANGEIMEKQFVKE